jgi:hypothetical protein
MFLELLKVSQLEPRDLARVKNLEQVNAEQLRHE